MVRELNDGTFFNLIFFDDSVDVFKPKFVVANPVTKKEAAEFIAPYYSVYGKELLENYSRDNRNWPSATRLRNYSMPVLEARAKYVHEGVGRRTAKSTPPLDSRLSNAG